MSAGYYNDLPISSPIDRTCIDRTPPPSTPFDHLCRKGPLSALQEALSTEPLSPAFLHRALTHALQAGNLQTAEYLLTSGAPILERTPVSILEGPEDQRLRLFDLLNRRGWHPHTHRPVDRIILSRVVNDAPVLEWFLAHGFNPNDVGPITGAQGLTPLELAANYGNPKSVRLLLDAGANIEEGAPLHCAAGRCPAGWNPHVYPNQKIQNEDSDRAQIPIMELLVERGAKVNAAEETQHMTHRYALVYAVVAGARYRVRWLLAKGADPDLRGPFGSARENAQRTGRQDLIELMD
ncbi:ankyrin [Aspergillus fijiensis CBS 313.89]|uniref:Ankyrin n=1 Tax=Aspergillus fijiensis CBS 313.89 TaxID=1448319 RepID=A0A8G1W1U4_9EURO|nr:ankyrin [Aspergillus fijiensis CBS 313.89]RAK80777.1 ankyrin [Aspergillus fijiensis CBS 313.89]